MNADKADKVCITLNCPCCTSDNRETSNIFYQFMQMYVLSHCNSFLLETAFRLRDFLISAVLHLHVLV